MENQNLPPGISHDGWIHKGYDYPDDFPEQMEKFLLPCSESHPEAMRICLINPDRPFHFARLRKCTYFELDDQILKEDGKATCNHCFSLGNEGLCQMHVDMEKYMEIYGGTPHFNPFQTKALQLYESGDFAHICSPVQLETAGDGLIACIVQELSDVEGCDSWDEALRRIAKMETQLAELYRVFRRNANPAWGK